MRSSTLRRLIRAAAVPVCGLAAFAAGFLNGEVIEPRSANAQLPGLQRTRSDSSKSTAVPEYETSKTQLAFISSRWETILEKLAKETGSTLVADRVPAGRFSHQDFHRYSRKEAVRILNDELEKHNFRLMEKNQFLVLIELSSARQEYRRAELGADYYGTTRPQSGSSSSKTRFGETRFGQRTTPPNQFQPRQRIGEDVTPRGRDQNSQVLPAEYDRFGSGSPSRGFADAAAERALQYGQAQRFSPRNQPPVRRAGFQEYDEAPAKEATPKANELDALRVTTLRYKPKTRDAKAISMSVFNAFRNRAEVIDDGPGGLPGIRVLSPKDIKGMSKLLFTIGVDLKGNELILEGPENHVRAISRLIGLLDAAPKSPNETTQFISTNKDAHGVAENLQPAVNQLVAQNDGAAEPPEPPATGTGTEPVTSADLGAGIRADVSVEALEELGLMIIKGNLADVEAVMKIIAEIEKHSARTAPAIHLRVIEHVDSAALAQLLSTVYEQLSEARGQSTIQRPDISIIPVGSPNAVLILSSPADLEGVNALIDELDKPVKPNTSFKVFRLRHAIASQMETMLEDFYTRQGTGGGAAALAERTGLMARIKIVADVRTNSVVVLAQPNDLKEIALLISQLDKPDSGAVAQVQIIELKHAVAEELADSLSTIIQSTLNRPQQGAGQAGGFGGAFGGQGSQELQDVRSSVLEFLGTDGKRMRSGILSDIRINGDARSNTLIVTAPRESMPLILELVKKLDRPASAVSTLRHFKLKNADAQLATDLLNELFGDQTTGNTNVGVQLAGAEEASSIIPMRFSVDTRTNSVIAFGTQEALEVVEALMYRLDAGNLTNHRTTMIKLKNIAAATVATVVSTFLQNQLDSVSQAGLSSAAEQIEQQVFFQSEDTTNTLLISATPQYFDQVREMVLTLDKEQPQVVIQALICEVTLEDVDEFGVNLGVQDPISFQRSGTGNFNFPGATLPNTTAFRPGDVSGQGLSNLLIGRASGSTSFGGLGGLVLSASSEYLNVLIRALQAHRHVEILSRPQVRTLDNQEALLRLDIEQQRPAGTVVNAATTSLNFETITAGILLQVTPTISPDGNILLQLIAEKSTFRDGPMLPDGAGGLFISVAKDVTRVESSIVVADQQTVVLGGLISRQDRTEIHKVPWVGDVPWFGTLFRTETNEVVRKELMIFLTPRIIRTHEDNELLKQIEAERMSYTESNAEALHGPIYAVPPQRQRDPNSGVISIPAPGELGPPPPMGQPLPLPGNAPPPPAPGSAAIDGGIPTSSMPARPVQHVRGQNMPAKEEKSAVLRNYERVFNRSNWFGIGRKKGRASLSSTTGNVNTTVARRGL
jgi:type II secretion system protein D